MGQSLPQTDPSFLKKVLAMNYLPRKEYFRHASAWLLYSEWEQVLPLRYSHQYNFYFQLYILFLLIILSSLKTERKFKNTKNKSSIN